MVHLSDVLKAIGPNAAIVFAAWIFMGFLQQRYDGALDRYRKAVGDYRSNAHEDDRTTNLKDQVLAYRRRCRLMGLASNVGLVAAILLIGSLIFGAVDVLLPNTVLITVYGTAAALGGFALVIVAAVIVLVEGRLVEQQIDDELRDIRDLSREAGNVQGTAGAGQRPADA